MTKWKVLIKLSKDTEVMKMIRNQADAHERSLKELHHNIDEQLNTIHEHFEVVVDKMRNKEHEILTQVEKLEKRLLGKVNKVGADAAKGTGWFWPFVLLLLFLGGIISVTVKRMKDIEKKTSGTVDPQLHLRGEGKKGTIKAVYPYDVYTYGVKGVRMRACQPCAG